MLSDPFFFLPSIKKTPGSGRHLTDRTPFCVRIKGDPTVAARRQPASRRSRRATSMASTGTTQRTTSFLNRVCRFRGIAQPATGRPICPSCCVRTTHAPLSPRSTRNASKKSERFPILATPAADTFCFSTSTVHAVRWTMPCRRARQTPVPLRTLMVRPVSAELEDPLGEAVQAIGSRTRAESMSGYRSDFPGPRAGYTSLRSAPWSTAALPAISDQI